MALKGQTSGGADSIRAKLLSQHADIFSTLSENGNPLGEQYEALEDMLRLRKRDNNHVRSAPWTPTDTIDTQFNGVWASMARRRVSLASSVSVSSCSETMRPRRPHLIQKSSSPQFQNKLYGLLHFYPVCDKVNCLDRLAESFLIGQNSIQSVVLNGKINFKTLHLVPFQFTVHERRLFHLLLDVMSACILQFTPSPHSLKRFIAGLPN